MEQTIGDQVGSRDFPPLVSGRRYFYYYKDRPRPDESSSSILKSIGCINSLAGPPLRGNKTSFLDNLSTGQYIFSIRRFRIVGFTELRFSPRQICSSLHAKRFRGAIVSAPDGYQCPVRTSESESCELNSLANGRRYATCFHLPKHRLLSMCVLVLVLVAVSVSAWADSAGPGGKLQPAVDKASSALPFTEALTKPRAVSVGPSGCVYIADMAGRISRFSRDGTLETQWEIPDQSKGTPSGLFVDAEERVFVADTHNSQVLVYDSSGQELARFGSKGLGEGEFLYPTDVVVDQEGCVYVSEYGGNDRISKFTPSFEFVGSFGTSHDGPGTLAMPHGLAIDGENTLWVADMGNHRLCRFDLSGALLDVIGGLGKDPGRLRYPCDLSLVKDQPEQDTVALIVADKGNSRLQALSLDGACIGLWGRPGRRPGMFSEPTGVAFHGSGIVIVTDKENGTVITGRFGEVFASHSDP